jgi:hypothetical protein
MNKVLVADALDAALDEFIDRMPLHTPFETLNKARDEAIKVFFNKVFVNEIDPENWEKWALTYLKCAGKR